MGPDLRVGVQGHTREELLQAILNPNAQILGLFQNYIVTTREGLVYGGVLAAEGPGSLTLRSGPGEEETILRARIAEIRASQVSLMPEGPGRETSACRRWRTSSPTSRPETCWRTDRRPLPPGIRVPASVVKPDGIEVRVLHHETEPNGGPRKTGHVPATLPGHVPGDLVSDDLGTLRK